MRHFYFDPDSDGDEQYEDQEDMMEVEGQFILMPDEIYAVTQENPLAIQLEWKKMLLFTTLSMLEKSWWWRWKSPKKKREMIEETYLMLEQLVRLEEPIEE